MDANLSLVQKLTSGKGIEGPTHPSKFFATRADVPPQILKILIGMEFLIFFK